MIKVDQGMEFQIETTYTQLISEHHSMGVEPEKKNRRWFNTNMTIFPSPTWDDCVNTL